MRLIILPLFTAVSLSVLSIQAQTTTWTGDAGNGVWSNGGNWTDGTVGFGGNGIFTGTPTDPMPILNTGRSAVSIDFQSAGWTIRDGGGSLRIDGSTSAATYDIQSLGAGVNRIEPTMGTSGSAAISINLGADNTLALSNVNWGKVINVSGDGTLVFDGTAQGISFSTRYSLDGNPTILINTTFGFGAGSPDGPGTWGGTGTILGRNAAIYTFTGENIIAPGGNGAFGSEIGTLSVTSDGTAGQGPGIVLDGASLDIQIGSTLGDNDMLMHQSERGGTGLVLQNDPVLNLFGDIIEDGTYTIAMSDSPLGVTGTFGTVNFNGTPIDPVNFAVNYDANAITVDISGVIPEPGMYATFLGAAVLGIAAAVRRQRTPRA